MRARASDQPKLFVPPPFLESDPRPLDLEEGDKSQGDGDGEEVGEEMNVEALDDEFAREETESWEEAVDDQEDGSERVDPDVEVRDSLEKLEPPGGEHGVVLGEEDLHRASCPTEDLVETVSEIDRSRAAEGITLCDAVNRPPAPVMHPVTGHHVFSDRPVNPSDPISPFRVVFIPEKKFQKSKSFN